MPAAAATGEPPCKGLGSEHNAKTAAVCMHFCASDVVGTNFRGLCNGQNHITGQEAMFPYSTPSYGIVPKAIGPWHGLCRRTRASFLVICASVHHNGSTTAVLGQCRFHCTATFYALLSCLVTISITSCYL